MQVSELLVRLGYANSPSFLGRRQAALATAPHFGHIFRKAKSDLALQGVYALRATIAGHGKKTVPVVYVCKAGSEEEADKFHRSVWNQDVVPFVLVHSPMGVKLYSGFRYERDEGDAAAGVLQSLTDFNDIADLVDVFHADSIDSGKLWRERGRDVTPEHRVNWRLLESLRAIDRVLCKSGLPKATSHALIGKYVYLHYLRDRKILSDKKLERWGIAAPTVFGRGATLEGLRKVVERLDEWLNGGIFPITLSGRDAPPQEAIRCVASIFSGDEAKESGERQLSFDFSCYDFSYIPIETLSNVYEQFLHASDGDGQPGRGKELGAYYTPIPVVNLMLDELEERRPIKKGMRVLDPSCGSGAFLVQCYRRLIEKEFPGGERPRPGQLRDLLEQTIFGVDVESDACNVAELSLALTLLDYVDPPDLEGGGQTRFRLPALRGENIFCGNFFDESLGGKGPLQRKFDWIVGNPPWKRLNPVDLHEADKPVWKWIRVNEKERPVGGNQVARAFAWKVLEHVTDEGEIGLFLPAMTLFEDPAREFRRAFFRGTEVKTVVNFSNLAEVLSAGRFRVPAAAFFYKLRGASSAAGLEGESVRVYSPLVANQEATRPTTAGRRNESWSIIVNASEIRDIPVTSIADGSGLPWKLATWGSCLDERLLFKLGRRHPSLGALERENIVVMSQGLELRPQGARKACDDLEGIPEISGELMLDVDKLKGMRDVFALPKSALSPVQEEMAYVRKGRARLPLSVCRPPHVIVSAARTFAVYDERFIVVPPRQIGIVSLSDDKDFLKALSLYLSSDFAFYHQFLTSTQFGVQRGIATLRAMRTMPIGIRSKDRDQLKKWATLHRKLAQLPPRQDKDQTRTSGSRQRELFATSDDGDGRREELLDELNQMVHDALGLTVEERSLVKDLVHVRLALNDGKTGEVAVGRPNKIQLAAYGTRMKAELDGFLQDRLTKRHDVRILFDECSGMVQVDLGGSEAACVIVKPLSPDDAVSQVLARTRKRLKVHRSQWVYFDRNLCIYEGTRTYLLKPMQRFQWTETQAMLDARRIIAETMEGPGAEG